MAKTKPAEKAEETAPRASLNGSRATLQEPPEVTPPEEDDDDPPEPQNKGPQSPWTTPKEERYIPPEVQNFITANGLPQNFTLVVLKKAARTGEFGIVKNCNAFVPTIDELVKELGTGTYQFVFSWYSAKLKRRDKHEPVEFTLAGDFYERMYKEEKERRDEEDNKKWLKGGVMGTILDGRGQPQKSPMESLRETLELVKLAGEANGGGRDGGHAVLAEAIKSQGESFRAALESLNRPRTMPDWLTGLITTAAASLLPKLIDKLMDPKTTEDEMGKFEKVMGMVERLKMLAGPKEEKEKDKWDRMLDLGEMIITPLVMRLEKMPPEERKNDPQVKQLAQSPMFKQITNSPQDLAAFVASFYGKFGAKATETVLDGLGYEVSAELRAEAEAERQAEAGDGAPPGGGSGAPGEG